ncbi:hypothetical protein B0H11DRAFT_1989553 [Mycena galericulata]|nr:hypothetical protein B0H11DRAFT_1989553 [Mycena galericulata]
MVLKLAGAALSYFPSEYTPHAVTLLILVLAFRRISQGRTTTRDRDLHARVIIVTGAFTPLGLTLLESLAQRGGHLIALTPHPVASPQVSTYIELLRSTSSNEQIYAEQCDLTSPPSVHAFAKRFLGGKGTETRVDALVCVHEYRHIGAFSFLRRKTSLEIAQEEQDRETASLATFLLTTLLLPALLVAPVERDIRIINVVNRWYPAAAAKLDVSLPSSINSTSPSTTKAETTPTFLAEGQRALRTVVLTRHLQRILDALPSAPPVPDPDATPQAGGSATPKPDLKAPTKQKSNIVAVSVSPGISRADSVAPMLGGSILGLVLYALAYPFLLLLTKSSAASVQSVLHVLFLPTPAKVKMTAPTKAGEEPEEVLKPGALYAECAVVRVPAITIAGAPSTPASERDEKGKAAEKVGEGEGEGETLEDDGELGGERAGRLVWEGYERALKGWEAAHPADETDTPREAEKAKAGVA